MKRFYDEDNDRYSWWAVEADGVLYQNYTPDGQKIVRVERQPADGSTTEVVTSGDVWTPNEEGIMTFWGVTVRSCRCGSKVMIRSPGR